MLPPIPLLSRRGIGAGYAHAARELKLPFGKVATREQADFRAADSIAERLSASGLAIHPHLVGLRLRIQVAMDEAEAVINASDFKTANNSSWRIQALVYRFARFIKGD